MSDPTSPGPDVKVTAPVGSHFLLKWETPASLQVTNVLTLFDGTTKRFDGPKPKRANGTGDVVLTITKDQKPDGFRASVKAPNQTQTMKKGGIYFNTFTMMFEAREPGDYLFTIALPTGKNLTEEVTVVGAADVTEKRQALLDIIDDWLPSSVLGAQKIPDKSKIPDGDVTRDILARSGYAKDKPEGLTWTNPEGVTGTYNGEGNRSFAKVLYNRALHDAWAKAVADKKADDTKPDPGPEPSLLNGKFIPVDTSCIAVMGQLMTLWGADKSLHVDLTLMTKADPQYYVKAAEEFAKPNPQLPKPGDILFLCIGGSLSNQFGHVCILVSASTQIWRTAEGGGGALPDQTAGISDKALLWTAKTATLPSVPIIASTTDGKGKALHGWANLDAIPNARYKADGSAVTPATT